MRTSSAGDPNVRYAHPGSPTAFYGSTIVKNLLPAFFDTWFLQLADGRGYGFGTNAPLQTTSDMFAKHVQIRLGQESSLAGQGAYVK